MRNILEIKNLVVSYGGIEAVKGIDLKVEEGKIVTLIGSNGAGKSTTLKAVAGLVKPKSGEILLNGANLVGNRPIRSSRAVSRLCRRAAVYLKT